MKQAQTHSSTTVKRAHGILVGASNENLGLRHREARAWHPLRSFQRAVRDRHILPNPAQPMNLPTGCLRVVSGVLVSGLLLPGCSSCSRSRYACRALLRIPPPPARESASTCPLIELRRNSRFGTPLSSRALTVSGRPSALSRTTTFVPAVT